MRNTLFSGLLAVVISGFAPVTAQAVELNFKAFGMEEGVRNELRAITLLAGLDENSENGGQEILAAAQADYARLIAALYDRGYYAPVIRILVDGRDAASIAPVRPPKTVKRVKVEVTPGPQFTFGLARVAPLAEGTELPEGFAVGQPAQASLMRDASEAAIKGWRDAGHARAEIGAQSITAKHAQAQLNADIVVQPGPKLRFGPVIVSGESAVREARIKEIAGIREGKDFSPEQLDAAAERLRRTGTFKSVALTESKQTVNGDQMPVEVQVVDMAPRRFGFGAEVSSNEGLTLSSFWLHRNFLGGAERLRLEGELGGIGGSSGGIDGRIALQFDRPSTFNARSDFYALAALERVDDPHLLVDSVTLEAGMTFRADSRRTFRGGIGFEAARTEDVYGKRDFRLLTLPLSATYDGRNSTLSATDGWYGRMELTPFAGISGVDSGARIYADLRGYRSVGERLVFALRGQLGSVTGPDLDRSPPDMLFYSGGSNTVRGHPYQGLGVTVPGGGTTGGRSFMGVQGEMRVAATDKISIVGFYDMGFVSSNSMPDGSNGTWHSGAGLGLRYATGIGPIRLDVAGPVSANGDGVQVYIGIGQAF